jgi:soluble lytic murein transglycosylase-like protein
MFRKLIARIGIACLASMPTFIHGQTLSGKTIDEAAKPLAGVRVALAQSKLSDTTGTDGLFEIKFVTALKLALKQERYSDISSKLFSASGRQLVPGATPDIQTWRKPAQIGNTPSFPSLAKSAAIADTLALSKAGYFTKKITVESSITQSLNDITLVLNKIYTKNLIYDKYDQFIVASAEKYKLDPSVAMVLKAMIVIESSFNANAISMYDTQLPCGTHSYGLIQVTPGCERGYATLPAGTPVTATISGGLNGVTPVLTYTDPADKTKGNTIVKENNIIIDLVTDQTSPLWSTSAFNPAYSIDNGAKALASVLGEMKGNFTNCSEANYVSMALAGYNQGSSTVSGCSAFSPNGQNYATNVIAQYRKFCTSAGISAVF